MFAKSSILALAALSTTTLAQISDDFESGWDKSTWATYAPDCDQGGSVSLDTSKAHSGSNSMKVVGGSNGYCGHIFFGTTEVPAGDDVYVRTWVTHATAFTDQHVTWIVMPDSGLGTKKHLRVSGQMEIIEYNRESDDATLPDLSPDGIASSAGLPTDTWSCFEYHLGSDGTIETWVDGELIDGLTVGPSVTNANSNGWGKNYKPNIQGVYFGWESYSGSVDTFWYDDIAVSTSRIGCSASGGSTGGGSTDVASSSEAAVTRTVVSSSSAPSATSVLTSSAVASASASAIPEPEPEPVSSSEPAASSSEAVSSSAPVPTSGLPAGGDEECEIEYVYV